MSSDWLTSFTLRDRNLVKCPFPCLPSLTEGRLATDVANCYPRHRFQNKINASLAYCKETEKPQKIDELEEMIFHVQRLKKKKKNDQIWGERGYEGNSA
jgi:hypothetical protein